MLREDSPIRALLPLAVVLLIPSVPAKAFSVGGYGWVYQETIYGVELLDYVEFVTAIDPDAADIQPSPLYSQRFQPDDLAISVPSRGILVWCLLTQVRVEDGNPTFGDWITVIGIDCIDYGASFGPVSLASVSFERWDGMLFAGDAIPLALDLHDLDQAKVFVSYSTAGGLVAGLQGLLYAPEPCAGLGGLACLGVLSAMADRRQRRRPQQDRSHNSEQRRRE